MRNKKNRPKDLRAIFKAAELIQETETPREADVITGYAVGIIEEKRKAGKLTGAAAEAIAEMVAAVGDGKRRELIGIMRGKEPDPEEINVLRFSDIREMALKHSEGAANE